MPKDNLLKANISVILTQHIDRSGVYIPGKQTRLRDVLSPGQVQVRRGGIFCSVWASHCFRDTTPAWGGSPIDQCLDVGL